MSDYQWKSNEPAVTPPRPKPLLSDVQLIIFWALTSAFGLTVGFFLGIGMGSALVCPASPLLHDGDSGPASTP